MNADNGKIDKQSADAYPHNDVTEKIIAAAYAVSNTLGCGFLEKIYENALVLELRQMGLRAVTQLPAKVLYRGQAVGDYVADLVVNGLVLVEIKATLEHSKAYESQIINYLHVLQLPVGLLLNFGQPRVKVQRFVLMNKKAVDMPYKPGTESAEPGAQVPH